MPAPLGGSLSIPWIHWRIFRMRSLNPPTGRSEVGTGHAPVLHLRNAESPDHIVPGTDDSTPWVPHVEMEDLVAAGMTPSQVIWAATRISADFLRHADAGTVEVAKRADVLVLEANLVEEITNTCQEPGVFLNGEQVARHGTGQ